MCYSLKEIYTFNLFSFNLSFSNRPAFTIKSLLTDPDIYSQHLKAINTILWLHHLYLVIEPVPKMIFIPFNQHHHPWHGMSIAKFVTASCGCTNMVSLRLNWNWLLCDSGCTSQAQAEHLRYGGVRLYWMLPLFHRGPSNDIASDFPKLVLPIISGLLCTADTQRSVQMISTKISGQFFSSSNYNHIIGLW